MVYITNCLCIQGNAIKFQVAACSTPLFPEDMLPISYVRSNMWKGPWGRKAHDLI